MDILCCGLLVVFGVAMWLFIELCAWLANRRSS